MRIFSMFTGIGGAEKAALRSILKDLKHKETIDGDYSIFWVRPKIHSKSLRQCFEHEDWGILQSEVLNWDGDKDRLLFRTAIEDEADFIQLVWASSGVVSTIVATDRIGERYSTEGKYIRKSIQYTVHQLKSVKTAARETKGNKISVDYEQCEQDSYCFNVPSHNLVLRHNKKIFVTGNCGKDTSKADVSVNIYAHLKAQETGEVVDLHCAIGDETIDGRPYEEVVEIAKEYIKGRGGFESFAEWGLV